MSTNQEDIEDLKQSLEDAQDDVRNAAEDLDKAQALLDDFEIDTDSPDVVELYEQMLDDVHGDFLGMPASRILKECDPIAYRVGMSDWVDSLDREDFQEYKDLEEARDEAQDVLDRANERVDEIRDALDLAESQGEASP